MAGKVSNLYRRLYGHDTNQDAGNCVARPPGARPSRNGRPTLTIGPRGVNRRGTPSWRSGARLLGLALATLAGTGCFRPVRDVPVDLAFTWTTYQGSPTRDPFAAESVPDIEPEIEWDVNTGRGLNSPPVPLGPVIVAATTNRMVIALSSESGDIYWEHRKHGPFMAPAVSDGSRLYLATSDVRGRVYALRLRDGREEWEEDHPGVSAPALIADGRLYLASEMGLISALRTRDGNQVWQTALGAPTAAAPALMEDRLVVATIRDTIYALDRENGEILEQRSVSSRISAAPASDASALYLPLRSGHVMALEADGLEERWRAHVEGPVLAAPVVRQDGTVFALSESGGVWSIASNGRPRKLADLGSAAVGGLTLTANAVLVGLLDGRLVALSPDDGRELWTVKLGDSVVTPPVVQDGFIYVPLRRGRVVKLR